MKKCIIIFNKEAKQWGAYKYKDKEDQLRVTVSHRVAKVAVENWCIQSTRKCCSKLGKWNIPISIK
jgi:cation transport regulator ChaB